MRTDCTGARDNIEGRRQQRWPPPDWTTTRRARCSIEYNVYRYNTHIITTIYITICYYYLLKYCKRTKLTRAHSYYIYIYICEYSVIYIVIQPRYNNSEPTKLVLSAILAVDGIYYVRVSCNRNTYCYLVINIVHIYTTPAYPVRAGSK